MNLKKLIAKILIRIPVIQNKLFVYKMLGVHLLGPEDTKNVQIPSGSKNNPLNYRRVIINPTVVGDYSLLYMHENARIQKNCFLLLRDKIEIGRNTGLAYGVTILTSANPYNELNKIYPGITAPVHIGDNVWVGANVTILPGVTIGDCSVIAAGSVVTKDIPEKVLAAGNPAVIKKHLER